MKLDRRSRNILLWWIFPGGLVLASATWPLSDPDMWWHLAAGRMILDGRFPMANTLSHTFPDYPWRFTQWLFGTLISLAETLGGSLAIQAVVCAFAAGTFLLVTATIRRDAPQATWSIVLPLVAVGVLSSRFRFVPRGDLATLLGLAAVHYLWVLRPRRFPLFLFLTGCLWANLHAGVVFGLLEIAVFGFAAVLDRDGKSTRDALICGMVFSTGSLVNPFLHYPYLYVLENIDVARHFPMPIQELMPPGWKDPRFVCLAALAILGLFPALVHRRYRDILLIAGSGAMAVGAVRFVPILAVLALPGVAKSFQDYRDLFAERFKRRGIAALFSGAIAATALHLGYVEWQYNPPGFGANLRAYPVGISDFILSKGFTGRMFNEFDHGGYLAWRLFPAHGVFIDGRGNAYPWDHFRQAAGYTRDTVRSALDKYSVDYAVIQRRAGNADLAPAFSAMGWQLVYIEGAAFLFVRPGSPDAARSRAEVFHSFLPWEKPELLFQSARANPEAMHADLLRVDPLSVQAAGDFNQLGLCAYFTGDPWLALRFLSAGLSLHPAQSSLRLNYAIVLESTGRIGEAEEQYRRIVGEDKVSAAAKEARRRMEAIAEMPHEGWGTVR